MTSLVRWSHTLEPASLRNKLRNEILTNYCIGRVERRAGTRRCEGVGSPSEVVGGEYHRIEVWFLTVMFSRTL